MSKQRDREEFVAIMTQEGVLLPVVRTIMRHGATLHRLAELECSSEAADQDRVRCPGGEPQCLCRDYGSYEDGSWPDMGRLHGTVPRLAVKEAQLQSRIVKLLAPYRVMPVFSGDPRGAVVKLKVPSGKTNDWGQIGVCVP